MVDRANAGFRNGGRAFDRLKTGEAASIFVPLNEAMNGIAIGGDAGTHEPAVSIHRFLRFSHAPGATTNSLVVSSSGIGNAQSDVPNAVSMFSDMRGNFRSGMRIQRRSQKETNMVARKKPGGAISYTGLQATIGYRHQPESCPIKIGGLTRVGDIKLNVVNSLEIKRIDFHRRGGAISASLEAPSSVRIDGIACRISERGEYDRWDALGPM